VGVENFGGEVSFLNLPSHHSITSSARAGTAAGAVRPSAAATGLSRPKDRHVGSVYL
jgi:hypothetical protein